MPEVEITRKQIIVVNEVGTNSYGDLTWTDKEGKSYKVKSARKQYFEAIVQGQAVEISFAKYRGTEYSYSAEAVKDKLTTAPPVEVEKPATPRPIDKEMTKSDWSEKDRITRKSIERQKALELAIAHHTNIRDNKIANEERVIATARVFESYLEGSPLLEEAKRLGAK